MSTSCSGELIMIICLELQTNANSFLLNIAEHENFLAQGCRRSRLLKQLLTPHGGRRTTDDGH